MSVLDENPGAVLPTEGEIFDALGKSKKLGAEAKSKFYEDLVSELSNLLNAGYTAFPNRNEIKQLRKQLQKMQKAGAQLKYMQEQHSYTNAIIDVNLRAINRDGRSISSLDDVLFFLEQTIGATSHARFFNKKKGPDTRLALEVSYAIARIYKKSFGVLPGLTGVGLRDDLTDKDTPFQRVCDLVARKNAITIGRKVQEKAIKCVKKDKLPFKFYRPSVHG